MRRAIIAATFWFVLISSACATSAEIPITPTNLDAGGYVFAVVAKPTGSNVSFHVIITSKKEDIYPDSGAVVDIITREKLPNGGLQISSEDVKSVKVTLEKGNRVWKADFIIPRELLKNPNLYFEYAELAHVMINGKITPMPSMTCYQMRLQDFAKP